MTNSLRPEIVTPIHSYTFRLVSTAIGFGVFSAVVALSARTPIATPPAPELATHEVLAAMPTVVAVEKPAMPARSSEVQLVFRAAGATYMKLADVGDDMPKHGALKLFDRGEVDDWQTLAIANVADVSPEYQRWAGKHVVVDGDCDARVVGFAVVARLTGTPDYAGTTDPKWTAASVMEHGAPVLAAKLDGCKDGTLARDAALPPIVNLDEVTDQPLAQRARAKLLASAPAKTAQLAWEKDERKGDWQTQESTAFHTIVARHPVTGVEWVSVHARVEEGCGGTNINIWGLYRVEGDQLVAAQQRDLGEVYSVDKLLDLDGDGEPEFLGKPWLGTDTVVSRASGDEVTRLALPFYGCPC